MIVHAMDLIDCRHQTSLLICVILVVVFPILVATEADKHEYGDTYDRKTEENREFSKSTKQSKHDVADVAKHSEEHSGRINDENGSSLNKFLEDVLKAQDDLKWIDQIVRKADEQKNWNKLSSTGWNKYPEIPNVEVSPSRGNKKVRDKRNFMWEANKRKYEDVNPHISPQRVYLDSDMLFERDMEPDNVDLPQNGINGQKADEQKSDKSSNEKEMNDQLPKEWANSKDICSLNDWLNSNKNLKIEQNKQEDEFNSRIKVRNQRDKVKKDESSLESLKETILELKKSLDEGEKKEHETKAKEKDVAKERNTRAKKKHKKHEKDKESSLWDSSEPEASDLKDREQDVDDLNKNSVHQEAWRRKRTEVNNEDGSSRKLFHRAGFGESYLEEKALKELHDRKRRSKGTPSDEKHDPSVSYDKNNLDEKDPAKVPDENNCNDVNDLDKILSNDLQTNAILDQGSKPVNNLDDTSILKNGNEDTTENSENCNSIDDKATKNNEQNDSVEIFGPTGNQISDKTSTLNIDAGPKVDDTKTQSGKAFKREEHQTRDNEERGKPFGQSSQGKRATKDMNNIDIVKSEDRNMVKLSNALSNDESRFVGKQPYVMNRFDVKKNVNVENEDKPENSMATMLKAQVGTPENDNKQKRIEKADNAPFGLLNYGKKKPDELYENKHDTMNEGGQRSDDEKRIENFVEINKGSTESTDKEGAQNWYKNHNRINTNDQDMVGKDTLGNKEDQLNDNKMKETPVENSNEGSSVNVQSKSNLEDKNKRRYTQVVIVPDGLDDRKLSDMYGQRRILQYMEYSNDDIEDADASFSDKEEDSQRQAAAEKSGASSGRKERDAVKQKNKAKVNLLIKNKLNKKKKKKNRERTRLRRNPVSVIEYYDYDSDNEQREHEAGEQERIKTNYDRNPVESDAGLEKTADKPSCIPSAAKKNKQEEEVLKKRTQKSQPPKQEFIVRGGQTQSENDTELNKQQESLSSNEDGSFLRRKQEQSGSPNDINRGRLNQPVVVREDKFLVDGPKDSETYIFHAEKELDPEMIDDFLEDIESMDGKKEKMSNFEPLYEELKKIYDWHQDENQNKPRIKGDHRMYYGANDKVDPTNKISESDRGQIELPETKASSPKLMPLLLHHDGSAVNSKICDDNCDDQPGSNVSQSNYYALKSTDDLFKGGSEQSNITEGQKLRGSSSIGALAEWTKQKVNELNNEHNLRKDAGSWSLTGRGRYIDTDSRSPYENRKYLESQLAEERVQNTLGKKDEKVARLIDPEKETVISSRDLHESFVDPLDQIDDFDEDIRLRLGRSLKTIDQERASKIVQVNPEAAKLENGEKGTSTLITGQDLLNVSKIQDSTTGTTSRSDDSRLGFLRYPPADLQELFHADGNRVKRQVRLPYDAFYDDANQPRADSEGLNYYGYSRDGDDEEDDQSSIVNADDEEADEEDYERVVRRAGSKDKKHKKRKKQCSKKKKRKDHVKKSKMNHRKRRHPKKHSNESKMKDHEHHHKNKHKKHAAKSVYLHSNVKKSKVDDKIPLESSANEKHTRQEELDNESMMNTKSEAQNEKISSLLMIDNVEDESQMDAALHGELPGKIVEHIFEQVQKNEDLKVSLGPGLLQKQKTRDTTSDKTYRQITNGIESDQTTELLNKIMDLLNRLVFDEAHKKTCVSLPPELTEFLDWMLDVNSKQNSVEPLSSLPLVQSMDVPDTLPKDKFLFQSSPGEEMGGEINELRGKLQLVGKLVNEYRGLPDKEKRKVQSVHDYLSKQLDSLLEYVDTKKEKTSTFVTEGVRTRPAMILQYQGGPGNISNAITQRPLLVSSLINSSSIWKPTNSKSLPDEEYFREDALDVPHNWHRTIRSAKKHPKSRKKHKKRRKHKKKHKRYKGGNDIDLQPHKSANLKAAASRRKREYLDKEFRDFFDSEYEEPLIYDSMDFESFEPKKGADAPKGRLKGRNEEQYSTLIGGTAMNRKDEIYSQISGSNDETGRRKLDAKIGPDPSTALANLHPFEKHHVGPLLVSEEPITGKDQLEDEIILLNKQQSWKKQNEEQLEEVAFGEDMRKALKEKELFEKLTEIDKKKNMSKKSRTKKQIPSHNPGNCTDNGRNDTDNLSDEDKLRMLEKKINVYSDK